MFLPVTRTRTHVTRTHTGRLWEEISLVMRSASAAIMLQYAKVFIPLNMKTFARAHTHTHMILNQQRPFMGGAQVNDTERERSHDIPSWVLNIRVLRNILSSTHALAARPKILMQMALFGNNHSCLNARALGLILTQIQPVCIGFIAQLFCIVHDRTSHFPAIQGRCAELSNVPIKREWWISFAQFTITTPYSSGGGNSVWQDGKSVQRRKTAIFTPRKKMMKYAWRKILTVFK